MWLVMLLLGLAGFGLLFGVVKVVGRSRGGM